MITYIALGQSIISMPACMAPIPLVDRTSIAPVCKRSLSI